MFKRGFIKFRTLDLWLEKQHTRGKSGIVGKWDSMGAPVHNHRLNDDKGVKPPINKKYEGHVNEEPYS